MYDDYYDYYDDYLFDYLDGIYIFPTPYFTPIIKEA